jgi:hypothetical protein
LLGGRWDIGVNGHDCGAQLLGRGWKIGLKEKEGMKKGELKRNLLPEEMEVRRLMPRGGEVLKGMDRIHGNRVPIRSMRNRNGAGACVEGQSE